VDAGLGYSTESRVVGPDQSFTLAAFGAAYKWQISSGATLTNSAIFTAPFGDADAWRFGNAFGIAASLTRVFTLKLSYDVKVNNDPVPGFEKTDRLTSMAIVAKF
jgi:putative salt-induced outer membrane protein YdiY